MEFNICETYTIGLVNQIDLLQIEYKQNEKKYNRMLNDFNNLKKELSQKSSELNANIQNLQKIQIQKDHQHNMCVNEQENKYNSFVKIKQQIDLFNRR